MYRRSRAATTIGVLFIIATVFFAAGQTLYDAVLRAPDYLDAAHAQRGKVVAGLVIGMIGSLSIPLIPAILYPIFRRDSEGWALGYLAMRIVEGMLLIVAMASTVTLLSLSETAQTGGSSPTELEPLGETLLAFGGWAFILSVGFAFPFGALLLNALLYRQDLVPRWITVWGLAAAALLLGGSVVLLLGLVPGVPEGTLETVLAGPIAINEMVLAVWLIAKGFREAGPAPGGAMPASDAG